MTGNDLIFQLFARLLGLSIAELLARLVKAWRISSGATRTGQRVRRLARAAARALAIVRPDPFLGQRLRDTQ